MNKMLLLCLIIFLMAHPTNAQNDAVCDSTASIMQQLYSRQTDGRFVDWHPTENVIIITNNSSRSYELINPLNDEVVARISQGIGSNLLQISPNGKSLATFSDAFIELTSIDDNNIFYFLDFGQLDQTIVDGGISTSLDWKSDSTQIAFANYQLHILDIDTQTLRTLQPEKELAGVIAFTVRWHPSGEYLAVYNGFGTIILLDPDTWKIVLEIQWQPSFDSVGYAQAAQALTWNSDGTQFAVNHFFGKGFQVFVYDFPSGERVAELPVCEGEINAIAWSPNGQYLAVAYGRPLQGIGDRVIRIWDVANNEMVAVTTPQTSNPKIIDWSPDGQMLASIDADMKVSTWEMP